MSSCKEDVASTVFDAAFVGSDADTRAKEPKAVGDTVLEGCPAEVSRGDASFTSHSDLYLGSTRIGVLCVGGAEVLGGGDADHALSSCPAEDSVDELHTGTPEQMTQQAPFITSPASNEASLSFWRLNKKQVCTS